MSAISRVNGSAVAATKDALASKLADAKAAEVKNTPQAMNDAAVASKEVVVKDIEKTVEVSKATTSAAVKLDSVQISDEAKSVNSNSSADKFNNAAATTKEAATTKTEASKEVVKSDSLQVTKEAVKTEKAERISKSRRTRSSRSHKVSTASKADRASKAHNADKAEKASRADKAEKTHGTKRDRKVEGISKHVSATEKVNNRDNKAGNRRYDASTLKEKTDKLSKAFKGLSKMGVSSKDVSKVIKSANRNMNEKLGSDLKQAYTDYKDKKISGEEFKSKLYEAAVKKVQGIASALSNNFMQKPSSGINNNGSTAPSFANKADNNGSTQAPRQSIFTKKDDAKAAPTPQKSIFDKSDSGKPSPTSSEKSIADRGNDKPSLVEEAAARNKEKSEEAKAAAKTDEKTAMAAKPSVNTKPEITEKSNNGNGNGNGNGLGQVEKAEKPEKAEGVSKLEKELRKLLDDIVKQAEKLPPGLAKKDEGPGKAEKVFEKIVGMFNDIDKMVNGLDKEVDHADENKGFGDFVNGLSEMFSNGADVKGNSFLKNLNKVADEHGASDAHKVGMEQIKAETLSSLFKGGSTNSSFGINRVGDNGEGSGNYSAVNFMSDMSGNVSDGLDSHKDAKEAREAATENGVKQANAEAELSALA